MGLSDGVWVAVLAAVIGPVLLAWLQGRQRRQERFDEAEARRNDKREDWRRQDEVADRAREVAELLLQKQNETVANTTEAAKLLVENNAVVAKTARVTNQKLDVIHTLVNSNMTAALQAELTATQGQVVLMKEVIALRRHAQQEPDPDAVATLAKLEEQTQVLEANLQDRLQQTKVADAQIFIAKEEQIDDTP